jgi:hypothetical protein
MPVKRADANPRLTRDIFERSGAAPFGEGNRSYGDQLFPVAAGIRPQALFGRRWRYLLELGRLLATQFFDSRGDWDLNRPGQAAMFKKRRHLRLSRILQTDTLFGTRMSCFLRLERNSTLAAQLNLPSVRPFTA